MFRRAPSGSWDTAPAICLVLGSDPVTALVRISLVLVILVGQLHLKKKDQYWYSQAPTQQAMLASVGKEVMLLDAWTSSVLRSFAVASEVVANILQGI